MALARWTATAQDAEGNAMAGCEIEVRSENTGALVPLFSDRNGEVALGNPFTADAATFFFHAFGGAYRVKATKGTFETEWRYVAIGTAGETDEDALLQFLAEVAGGKMEADGSNVGDASAQEVFRQAIGASAASQNPLGGHLFGLTMSNNSSDADHDLDIAAGEAASDDAAPVLIKIASALTKRADATFAAGSGNGGMVSGESLPTSGTIHVWLIMKADGTADVCFNNQASSGLSPTLPTEFIYKRRIGSLITNSSANIVGFLQLGDHFELQTRVSDFDGSFDNSNAVKVLSVPTGFKVRPKVAWTASQGSTAANILVSDPDTAAQETSGTIFSSASQNSGANAVQSNFSDTIFTDTSGRLRFRSGNTVLGRIVTHGWVDDRGKNY